MVTREQLAAFRAAVRAVRRDPFGGFGAPYFAACVAFGVGGESCWRDRLRLYRAIQRRAEAGR